MNEILKNKFKCILKGLPYKEEKKSYGIENLDRIFYVIRLTNGGGLFSYIISNLGRINYAISNNWVPVIDMQNYDNTYLEPRLKGKQNSWEYYFKQPMDYGLTDITRSRNIILSNPGIIEMRPRGTMECLNNENGILDYWRKITRIYLKFNDDTDQIMNREYKKLIKKNDRIIGVICRGTDYTSIKPAGHWVQPDVKDVIKKARSVMSDYQCTKIFLATEDKKIYQQFVENFGTDVILTNEKNWIDYEGGYINSYESIRKNDRYYKGLEYLTTIFILSKCNCIIGGRAGGTVGAMIMSDGYEYQYFWDLGIY